jgi:hypothetical protein
METNNYIVIYSGVNRSTRTQVGVIIWIFKSVKNQTLLERKNNWGDTKF